MACMPHFDWHLWWRSAILLCLSHSQNIHFLKNFCGFPILAHCSMLAIAYLVWYKSFKLFLHYHIVRGTFCLWLFFQTVFICIGMMASFDALFNFKGQLTLIYDKFGQFLRGRFSFEKDPQKMSNFFFFQNKNSLK